MKRYLRPDLLNDSGVAGFDDWAAAFGEVVTQFEPKPGSSNEYRIKSRFAKFVNLPELMGMYKEFADIQTADMLSLPVPNLKGGKPQIVACEPSPFQLGYMKELGRRSERIHNGDALPEIDNMLKVTNEARLLGLDDRCINPSAKVHADGKVAKLIDNLIKIYTATAKDKGTQIVFCDIAVNSDDGKFSVYDAVKDDKQRDKMYEQLRTGEKRFILASTTKLGTGANIQDRLAAVHHLDIPWRPSDVEQRNGRIIRQGNMFGEVDIFHYTTKETFDMYMLNILTTKQKFISQIMTSKCPARTCEDVDETVLTYSEMQAITSGNPMIKEKIELDNDVSRLRILESEHIKQQHMLQKLAEKELPEEIETLEKRLKKINKDLNEIKIPEDFSIKINGIVYTERTEAGTVLHQECLKCAAGHERREIGEYGGFKLILDPTIRLVFNSDYSTFNSCTAILKNNFEYSCEVELSGDYGNILRIENSAKKQIPSKISETEQRLQKLKSDLAEAKANLNSPFEHAEDLQAKAKRLEAVNAELSRDDRQDILTVGGDKENIQKEEGNSKKVISGIIETINNKSLNPQTLPPPNLHSRR